MRSTSSARKASQQTMPCRSKSKCLNKRKMSRRRKRKKRSRPPSLRGTRSSRRSRLPSTSRKRPSRLICQPMRTWTITMTSTVTMWLVQVWAMVAPTTRASIWTTCLPSISSERRTAVLISSLKTSFYSQLRQKMVAKSVWLVQDSKEDHQLSCETFTHKFPIYSVRL